MSNKNLDRILNNTEDLEIIPIKNVVNNNTYARPTMQNSSFQEKKVEKKEEVRHDYSISENEFQNSNVINVDRNEDFSRRNNDVIEENHVNPKENNQKITITKNIGKILDVPSDALIQTMGDGKIFNKSFKVKIIGVGGAGNNIIKYVYNSRTWPSFVEIKAINTDYIALKNIPELAGSLLLMGSEELKGNGSGGDPEMGKRAAEGDSESIKEILEGTDILILVSGLGKGTGTGATPVMLKLLKI